MRWLNNTRIGSVGGGGGSCGQGVLFKHARLLTCFAKIISAAQRWTKDVNEKEEQENKAQNRP